jgi:phosphatidylglycerophosphatase C
MNGRSEGGPTEPKPGQTGDGDGSIRPLAAFDLDGTLTRRDTLRPFLVRAIGRDRTYRGLLASSFPLARAAALGGPHRDRAKAAVLERLLGGRPLAELAETAESYADHVITHALRDDTRARLEWHRGEGHELVLVSASPELYVTPIGRRLGFDSAGDREMLALAATATRVERRRRPRRVVVTQD